MKLVEFPVLADENIHPGVIAYLQQLGCDVKTVLDLEGLGLPDARILELANQSRRIVITQDSDFGKLAILQRQPFLGIVYLRPGHIRAEFTIDILRKIFNEDFEVNPPYIIIAERGGQKIRIRIRRL